MYLYWILPMSDKDYTLADSTETGKRANLLEQFVNSVFDEKERPYYISDKASLYDITCADEKKIINRIKITYGVSIVEECFNWPICELLDFISSEEKQG